MYIEQYGKFKENDLIIFIQFQMVTIKEQSIVLTFLIHCFNSLVCQIFLNDLSLPTDILHWLMLLLEMNSFSTLCWNDQASS